MDALKSKLGSAIGKDLGGSQGPGSSTGQDVSGSGTSANTNTGTGTQTGTGTGGLQGFENKELGSFEQREGLPDNQQVNSEIEREL
ncbi:hypothetical protein SAICODRAFT_22151 [Saitoella complicata NRRL Y-17804]|uniref:Uncharacterized protein n=1 Tax=Saitoella complicata (strain BCRC 22490 / CBS 7301 / JCM 7358 / NBRC 10748 / NRRL Y-17804) TaxID=698492 RepID=A0A0E9NCP0_SAICN|nr:uncharacterized protein SAICODRAFT_22151 [Saitoella complicata NRRL Y-17804]ODQ49945.1 hypothetical protein SAICODRAFT_22151 [Saitoella complicata NRRL Y-17804]GAO47632.1 hypothetical protein G7K_1832-t1 [Saitoella complicata NRRL Y-17804]